MRSAQSWPAQRVTILQMAANTKPRIGTLGERSLHAALKRHLAKPGDDVEYPLDGYVIDIRRGDKLIEVQTTGFSSVRRKYRDLVTRHRVHVIHPIAIEKHIIWLDEDGAIERKSKSTAKRSAANVFDALTGCPDIICSPNFTLEVILVREEEVRQRVAPRRPRRWNRDWKPVDHRLMEVVERRAFRAPGDLLSLLPDGLPDQFTNADLVKLGKISRHLAQRVTYCLRNCGAISVAGKKGKAVLYERKR